jgi:hypothetical protein
VKDHEDWSIVPREGPEWIANSSSWWNQAFLAVVFDNVTAALNPALWIPNTRPAPFSSNSEQQQRIYNPQHGSSDEGKTLLVLVLVLRSRGFLT